ncbi:nucleoside hydrolase [Nocardia sp. NPDC051321]|uniref:nucleoside hydrolase n=1 Tax=Nocardia sp. NPDC051321 TaxID=3364323 RepID=UPI0037B7AAE3
MFCAPFLASGAPQVLLDTDIGYDLDDALTVWAATRTVTELGILTTDETPTNERAHLTTEILHALGRTDVPVIAGRKLPGAQQRFLMAGQTSVNRPLCTDLIDYVSAVYEGSTQPVIWVCMGPASNLADVLIAHPEFAEQTDLVMMGGWLDHYRRPDRASHNPRMDPRAFGLVMRAIRRPRLVMSTHTNAAALAITPASPLYSWLTMPQAPADYALIAENATRWFAHRLQREPGAEPSSWMSDVVTLAAALDVGVVDFATENVRIEEDALMYRDPNGCELQVSTSVDLDGFLDWLSAVLPVTAMTA